MPGQASVLRYGINETIWAHDTMICAAANAVIIFAKYARVVARPVVDDGSAGFEAVAIVPRSPRVFVIVIEA